jgi:hypothetical protein
MSASPERTPLRPSVDPILVSSKAIEAAMQRGVRDALRRHKALGESIAVSRDGKVVIVPAEEIVVPDLPGDGAS